MFDRSRSYQWLEGVSRTLARLGVGGTRNACGRLRGPMSSWLSPSPRLSYSLGVLPILRTTLLGSVFLTLALLAGFAVQEPVRPHLSHVVAPARGPLIEANDHPEWKQFLVQAAFRRADELERLRDLPASPMVIEAAIEPAVIRTENVEATVAPEKAESAAQVAVLAPERDPDVMEDITASIDEKPTGMLPVEIGASSSAELPLSEQETLPQVRQPETLKLDIQSAVSSEVDVRPAAILDRLPESRPKFERKRVARVKKKPPAKPVAEPAVPDLLSTIFGNRQANTQ